MKIRWGYRSNMTWSTIGSQETFSNYKGLTVPILEGVTWLTLSLSHCTRTWRHFSFSLLTKSCSPKYLMERLPLLRGSSTCFGLLSTKAWLCFMRANQRTGSGFQRIELRQTHHSTTRSLRRVSIPSNWTLRRECQESNGQASGIRTMRSRVP